MMYRTRNCGELRRDHAGESVVLSGWVQRVRRLGGLVFLDLRDRWGITQVVVDDSVPSGVRAEVEGVGREWVLRVEGVVRVRSSVNGQLATGEVEVLLGGIVVLNRSEVPPFTIEVGTDGGEELRMRYRYLDIRRGPVRDALLLRHAVARATREYLDGRDFCEVETPFLIKSTPEGARDFVVPSRMHAGEFYALPQSPQTFKQLLMVGGLDRYYQIARCFRDEDLRADRQPEFTQVDCEMSFVEREDVLREFEGYVRHVFRAVRGVEFDGAFPRMAYSDAMSRYGSDKPDLRVGMAIGEVSDVLGEVAFGPYDGADYLGGICVPGGAGYTRKQLDGLVEYVRRPQVGGGALVYIRGLEGGEWKSSADKHFSPAVRERIGLALGAGAGDLMLLLAGKRRPTQVALGALRLEVARREGWLDPGVFVPLWVVDFPLLEWDEEQGRFFAMHHPFTSPVPEDVALFDTDPGAIRANAYDLVVNGTELGGGSIRIHDSGLQARMFDALGFSKEEAQRQFGFLMDAFRYGAPPHGGIAFGFDRMCALLGGSDSIRDYIAFPKNNAGRDVMIASPSPIDGSQLAELGLDLVRRE